MDFNISIFSSRWGHDDYYHISVDANTLTITGPGARNAICKYDSSSVSFAWDSNYGSLVEIFRNDSIIAPENVLDEIQFNWSSLIRERITPEQFKENFNSLAEWISIITKNEPTFHE